MKIDLANALQFEDAGDLAQARIAYDHLIRTEQPSAKLFTLTIRHLIAIGDLDSAKSMLDIVCPTSEEPVHQHFITAQIYYAKAIFDFQAEEYWCRQLDSSSETYPHIFLGSCLAQQGKLGEALEAHRKATEFPYKEGELQPDEAWLNIALISRAKGDYQSALEAANTAMTFDPDCSEAQAVAADVSAAIELLQLGPDVDFDDPGIFLLANECKYAQSFVITRKRLVDEPDWIAAQTHLGVLLVDFRQFAEAENHIRFLKSGKYLKVVQDAYAEDEIESNAEEEIQLAVLEVSACLEMRRGNLEKAVPLLRQLVQLQRLPGAQAVELGECLTSLQRYDEALNVYQSIRTRSIKEEKTGWPDEWAIKLSGHIHRSQQRYQKAAELYQIGADRYPENDEFLKLAKDCLAAIELTEKLWDAN